MRLSLIPLDLDEANAFVTRHHRHHKPVVGGAAARAAFALGYQRIGTYLLARESGSSVKAAGWRLVGRTPGRSWSVPSRPRVDTHPLEPRMLFERAQDSSR